MKLTDDKLKKLIKVLELKTIEKGKYYKTGWGKKTEQGLKETIKNILK